MFSFLGKINASICVAATMLLANCTQSDNEANDQDRAENNDSESRPNIVLIMADDMGYSDISCYGSEINTPNLDELANNGIRFSQFYNTARSAPTRASLLTGLYPAQTGLGFMTGDQGKPGYRGEIGDQCVTIAEVLKQEGYHNYMVGKWHVARNWADIDSLKYNWPLQRGFDKFYGTIGGANSYYDPTSLTRGNNLITPENDPEYQPEDTYYYTDAITDNALKFLTGHNRKAEENPFFMYVAYTAPHWPLHAPEEEIAQHEGKYDEGYGPVRKQRYERLKSMGLIDDNCELSKQVAKWDTLSNKDWHARNMEVYAAMITRMDNGIGKIMDKLKENNQFRNTLFLFLSDNGGNMEKLGFFTTDHDYEEVPEEPAFEAMGVNELQKNIVPNQTRDGYPVIKMGKKVMAGSATSYHAYGPAWANVSNTPFRKYKHYIHEGGTATPFIAHWPAVIEEEGEIRHQRAYVTDIMPTLVEITGADYPGEYNGKNILPMEGVSLYDAITKNDTLDRDIIYFEHEGNRGLRKGKWKLVSKAYPNAARFMTVDTLDKDQWRLYNIESDRTESNDLSDEYPDKVEKLSTLWYKWAKRTNTIPKPK